MSEWRWLTARVCRDCETPHVGVSQPRECPSCSPETRSMYDKKPWWRWKPVPAIPHGCLLVADERSEGRSEL